MSGIQKIRDEQALCFAAKTGNYQAMAALLQSGVCVDAEHFNIPSSMTPLQFAAERGHLQCVELLIEYGAKLNATSESGLTAVYLAAEMNHYLCLKALLRAGADPSLPVCRPSKDVLGMPNVGTTALHLAATYRNAKCIEELMRYGADCDAVDKKGRTALYIAAEAGCEQSVLTLLRNIHGVSCVSLPSFDTSDIPLHHAVKNRMVECVKEMVLLGADVNHVNCRGLSPLHSLFVPHTEGNRLHDVTFLNCTKGTQKSSDLEILKYLVLDSRNIDINKTTKGEKTALDFAFEDRDPEMLKFLITYGADVTIKLNYFRLLPLKSRLGNSDFDIEYLVNCVPQLPHLGSLNVYTAADIMEDLRRFFHVEELVDILGEIPVMMDEQEGNMQVLPVKEYSNLRSKYSDKLASFMLRQPLLDKVYEAVIQKLEQMKEDQIRESSYVISTCDGSPQITLDHRLLRIKKQLWYERLASTPRTLQHWCRFSIRKCMGPSNLKHICKLPVPECVKSYLLFKCHEQKEP